MQQFEVVEQELISFLDNGFRYGNKMQVLARSDEHLLVWMPGNTSFSNRNWVYTGSMLIIFKRNEVASTGAVVVCEHQSLMTETFLNHANTLDDIFGAGFHQTLSVNKTVVLGRQPVAKVSKNVPFGLARANDLKRQKDRIVEELEIEVSYILAA